MSLNEQSVNRQKVNLLCTQTSKSCVLVTECCPRPLKDSGCSRPWCYWWQSRW